MCGTIASVVPLCEATLPGAQPTPLKFNSFLPSPAAVHNRCSAAIAVIVIIRKNFIQIVQVLSA